MERRIHEKGHHVIVSRELSRGDIIKYAALTKKIRGKHSNSTMIMRAELTVALTESREYKLEKLMKLKYGTCNIVSDVVGDR